MPDAILTKPSRLTPSEYDVMKRHAADGADIIARLSRLKDAVPAVRHHHEHWDGCGYPDGLRAEEIPLEASIIGLADAWDAMTTTRPYAAARSQEDAMAQLESGSGVQFNPGGRPCLLRGRATTAAGDQAAGREASPRSRHLARARSGVRYGSARSV